MAALIRKRIANEVAFSYSGEAYFYAWARQRAQMVAATVSAPKGSFDGERQSVDAGEGHTVLPDPHAAQARQVGACGA